MTPCPAISGRFSAPGLPIKSLAGGDMPSPQAVEDLDDYRAHIGEGSIATLPSQRTFVQPALGTPDLRRDAAQRAYNRPQNNNMGGPLAPAPATSYEGAGSRGQPGRVFEQCSP